MGLYFVRKNVQRKVKPFYDPLHLLLKQAIAIILYAAIAGWNKKAFISWLAQPKNLIHAGAGIRQIGCFGVNPHVVWEVTNKCNLSCIHCHAFGGGSPYNELTYEDGISLIDEIASSTDIRTLVFAGGEPLLRDDLFELTAYAKSVGFNIFIATNGTLITEKVAKLLKRYEVGVVIGLDAMDPEIHDHIRGVKGAFDAVMAGIKNSISENLYLHLNVIASKPNFDEIARIIDYGDKIGVYSYFIYNFVPTGRGEDIPGYVLGLEDFKKLLELILEKQKHARSIIIPVAAPEYWAYVLQSREIRSEKLINFLSHFFHGCIAGKGMMYIKPNGDVWPCPFLPIRVGNVKKAGIDRIRRNMEMFGHDNMRSDCNGCIYERVCGGCKTRMTSSCPLMRLVYFQ